MNRRTFLFAATAATVNWCFKLHATDISIETGIQPMWRAAIITDTHTSRWDWISAFMSKLKEGEPRILIHTGDTNFNRPGKLTMRAVADMALADPEGIEFHLAPGNHDMRGGALKSGLRRAAIEGIIASGTDEAFSEDAFQKVRWASYVPGPVFGAWNPEILRAAGWQTDAKRGINIAGVTDTLQILSASLFSTDGVSQSCRYVFKRGGIRFIVCDWAYSKEQREWLRGIISDDDGSSVSIVLHHGHCRSKLRRYFEGFEGRHNVKLVLSGHDHSYDRDEWEGITFVTGAGIALGNRGECDAMMLNVYRDHLRLDRYVIPKRFSEPVVLGPEPIWACEGDFAAYRKPGSFERERSFVRIPESDQKVFYKNAD